MKYLFKFLLLVFLFNCFEILPQIKSSQVENTSTGISIKLEFKKEKYNIVNLENRPIIEYPQAFDESKPGTPALPKRIIYVAIPPKINIQVSILNKQVSSIENVEVSLNGKSELKNDSTIIYKKSEPDLKAFSTDVYPPKEVEVIGYTWIRDFYCAVIQLNTHSYNWKKNKLTEMSEIELKIDFIGGKSFTLNQGPNGEFDEVLKKIIVNYNYASSYRTFRDYSFTNDTFDGWIDYSKEYIKLAIPEDGLYRITYDDLLGYNINPSMINPSSLKIFLKGKQIPIFVRGEEDLSFNQDDYIEFYAEKNYGSANYRNMVAFGDDYLNYFDRYNDTTFIWLSWEGEPGLRNDTVTYFISSLSDTLQSHIVKLHFEKDERLWYYDAVSPRVQLPFWQENKVWTWYYFGNGGSIAFNFDSPDFVPNTIVKTTTRLISNASDIISNAHSNGASLNSTTPSDSISYNFRQTVNFSPKFNSNILKQTGNTFFIFGLPTQASFYQVLIDWVDIDFYRWNVASNDSLLIRVPDTIITSPKVMKISNISNPSSLVLYKVKPAFKKISNYNFSEGILTFTDTVSGGDVYIAFNQSYIKTPLFIKKKRFVNLRDQQRGADYIIISNKELEQSVNDYKNFISSAYSVRTELVFVDDIYDEFSYGFNNAEVIRDFLLASYINWQSPKPSFVNFIGDANYDYKKVIIPPTGKVRKNLVPSFGDPVSDVCYVTWDSNNVNIPQMFVGRIPAATNDEVYFYLHKHQSYIGRKSDEWNKHYLFFSGGDINDLSQLSQIKNANDIILNNIVKPSPVGGNGVHFYKTINPATNLGPYTQSEINEAIGRGGLFISYIGHSGTQTWDNGITSIIDLKNEFSDRYPLITDFGCSTSKFAEPDIDAFGELFILESPDGQAINYCGNSSWGYLSTSLRFPDLFYQKFLLDTILRVGEAHLLAKIQQFNESGYSDVNRVFNYCNLLLGDPIVSFSTPTKPNFAVSDNSFQIVGTNPNDQSDSVTINVKINNFGRVIGDSLDVLISDTWQESLSIILRKKIPVPLFIDSLMISIPIQGKVGKHSVVVKLDESNLIEEIDESDNIAEFNFTVYSTAIRPIKNERFYTTFRDKIKLLNPTLSYIDKTEELVLSLSSTPDFSNQKYFYKNFDTVITEINIDSLTSAERYWWRVKLNSPNVEWSEVYSFRNIKLPYAGDWFIDHSFNEGVEYQNTNFDSSSLSWELGSSENVIEVHSAGGDDGEYGSILFNGQEMLPNTFYWGIATAEIDTLTFQPTNFKYFLYWDQTSNDSLSNYLNSLSNGTVVAMTICSDGAQAVLGFNGGTPVRRAIENYGSLYVDSVRYRDSWCLFGKKGAPKGSVPESFSKRYFGEASFSQNKVVNYTSGSILFPNILNSTRWLNIFKNDSIPTGSSIGYFPIGIRMDGQVDTLPNLIFSGDNSSLSGINASLYSKIKILSKFNSNDLFGSPRLNSITIDYISFPELGTNYQVVSISKDSVLIGEDVTLGFYVYNVGEARADSFKVQVEIVYPDNSHQVIFETTVDSLNSLSRRYFNFSYNTSEGTGQRFFNIKIDSGNKIPELYEDNNFFTEPFYVKGDTSVPSLNITFDGIQILDGDYISDNPEIKIELNDPSLLQISDTSSISILLNDKPVYYSGNIDILNYQFSSANPKMIVTYKPHLASGEYKFKVFGKNALGNSVNSAGIEKTFFVSEEAKILYVYNYPNPFSGETYFTFKLTQIPDELKIKIFTIAGRLVKEIKKTSAELNFDFNRIHWDGRDQDGDLLANGTYFYKIIMTRGNQTSDVLQKIAIVR